MLFCSVCLGVSTFRLLLIVLYTSCIGDSCCSGWCLLLQFLLCGLLVFGRCVVLCAELVVVDLGLLVCLACWVWLGVLVFGWLLWHSLLSLLLISGLDCG